MTTSEEQKEAVLAMRVTQVMVEFERRVNDGDYGSEKATAQYVALVDEGEDPDEVVRQLVTRGRERVIGELKASETLAIRHRLNPPKRMCAECGDELGDDESYVHDACLNAHRVKQGLLPAGATAEAELADIPF